MKPEEIHGHPESTALSYGGRTMKLPKRGQEKFDLFPEATGDQGDVLIAMHEAISARDALLREIARHLSLKYPYLGAEISKLVITGKLEQASEVLRKLF